MSSAPSGHWDRPWLHPVPAIALFWTARRIGETWSRLGHVGVPKMRGIMNHHHLQTPHWQGAGYCITHHRLEPEKSSVRDRLGSGFNDGGGGRVSHRSPTNGNAMLYTRRMRSVSPPDASIRGDSQLRVLRRVKGVTPDTVGNGSAGSSGWCAWRRR